MPNIKFEIELAAGPISLTYDEAKELLETLKGLLEPAPGRRVRKNKPATPADN
jgi:hypothetical protein